MRFECAISDGDPSLSYEASFQVSGTEVSTVAVTGGSFAATITTETLGNVFMQTVTCCFVATCPDDSQQVSNSVCSEGFLSEVTITPPQVTVNEGESQTVVITSTIESSFLCDTSLDPGLSSLVVPSVIKTGNELSCGGSDIPQVVFESAVEGATGSSVVCGMQLDSGTTVWNLAIKGTLDGITDGDVETTVDVRVVRRNADGTEACSYNIGSIQVTVIDSTSSSSSGTGGRRLRCDAYMDPHIEQYRGADQSVDRNSALHFYLVGRFILYSSTVNDYAVEVSQFICNTQSQGTCICGVAIRQGDDVFRLTRCQNDFPNGNYQLSGPLVRQLFLNGDLDAGFTVIEQGAGQLYEVYVSSGAKIVVSTENWGSIHYMDVTVYTTSTDNGEGICGSPQNPETAPSEAEMADFRTTASNTFWDGVSNAQAGSTGTSDDTVWCQCFQEEQAQCSADHDQCVQGQTSAIAGPDITAQLVENAIQAGTQAAGVEKRRKRQTETGNNNLYDENFVPPETISYPVAGMSEQDIIDICQDTLDNFPGKDQCMDLLNTDYSPNLASCAEDIARTGEVAFANGMVNAIKRLCKDEIGVLPDQTAYADLLNELCSSNCNNQGDCVGGVCDCYPNRGGAFCEVDLDSPPIITGTHATLSGVCPISDNDNCTQVLVYGSNFFNSEDLKCHLVEVEVTEDGVREKGLPEVTKDATFQTSETVFCSLSRSRPHFVSVSNRNNLKSSQALFIPYDEVCTSCSVQFLVEGICEMASTGCFIDGVCYDADELNPSDACLECNVEKSTDSWTAVIDPSCPTDSDEAVLIAVIIVCCAVGVLILALVIFLIYEAAKRRGPADVPILSPDRKFGTYQSQAANFDDLFPPNTP